MGKTKTSDQKNPLRPSEKQFIAFEEPSETFDMGKTKKSEKTFEEPKQMPTTSNKKDLDFFDEPSESFTFQKTKPIEKPKEPMNMSPEKPSNKNALAFLEESSEALAMDKPKIIEKPKQEPTDIFGERPSKKTIESEPKSQDIASKETEKKPKDIFGAERPSNKKGLDFLDESSEALGVVKTKSEKPIQEPKIEEPAIKTKRRKGENVFLITRVLI